MQPLLRNIVHTAFGQVAERLPAELAVMPFSHWTEAVFRYFFGRVLAISFPHVSQFVECDQIDLVLADGADRAFIEFKLYGNPVRYDPYTGEPRGYKGGPSAQNLAEFRSSIGRLHGRPHVAGLLKFVIVLYADPAETLPPRRRYADYLGKYEHSPEGQAVITYMSSRPVEIHGHHAVAALYELRENKASDGLLDQGSP